MKVLSVCAVVVTYHPSPKMIDNMTAILAQVDRLVVIDNGSTLPELEPLRKASKEYGFQLIENGDNLGIAEALNQGIREAIGQNYAWVILFDQDSRITHNFIAQMLSSLESHPAYNRIGSFHPKYVDPGTGKEPHVWRAQDGGPVLSLTSGALMPTWIFEKIGFFTSEFFIDWVDIEYSFRIRAAGFQVADSRDAVLLHAAGHPTTKRFFGLTFRPFHHSSTRYYYMARNRVVTCRKYFRIFPGWITHALYISLKENVKCFLGEEDRLRKLRSILIGGWDGLRGRMGKRENI